MTGHNPSRILRHCSQTCHGSHRAPSTSGGLVAPGGGDRPRTRPTIGGSSCTRRMLADIRWPRRRACFRLARIVECGCRHRNGRDVGSLDWNWVGSRRFRHQRALAALCIKNSSRRSIGWIVSPVRSADACLRPLLGRYGPVHRSLTRMRDPFPPRSGSTPRSNVPSSA